MNTKSIGKNAAIALASTEWWVGKTPRQIALFQLSIEELCCPFQVFHEAIEGALGRSVYTHEFAFNPDRMYLELIGEADPPSMDEIINMLPNSLKLIINKK